MVIVAGVQRDALLRARLHLLGQIQQGETIGGPEGIEHALDAVAVGIGLDHRPHAGIEGRAPRPVEVVAQCIGMDGGEDGTRHGG